MKGSRYNYIVPFGKKTIFFNGISEAFFLAEAQHVEAYKAIIKNPDSHQNIFPDFIEKMITDGFIINDETNELNLIRGKHHDLRRKNQYFLLVLPTYECNLRCWYCTQHHENLFMTEETVARLKRLIERKLADETISDLHISWFGGEPLMAYDKVLDITLFARDLAKKSNKTFSSAITTNSTLLNPERIEALHNAGIDHYQITIDGDRQTHNSVKKLGKISAYDRTIDNINMIARHSTVSLRFNYTKDNLKPDMIFADLREKLNPSVTHNIAFTIFKVWQEKQENVNDSDIDYLFDQGIAAGMASSLFVSGLCYADQLNYDCIFPNGHVAKCDNHSPADSPGILQEDGTILWTQDITELYEPHLFDGKQSICTNCRYLPICWGPCVAKRETMLRNYGQIKCQYENPDPFLERLIRNNVKTRLQQSCP